jgi:hypothetical protein
MSSGIGNWAVFKSRMYWWSHFRKEGNDINSGGYSHLMGRRPSRRASWKATLAICMESTNVLYSMYKEKQINKHTTNWVIVEYDLPITNHKYHHCELVHCQWESQSLMIVKIYPSYKHKVSHLCLDHRAMTLHVFMQLGPNF